jgi:phytoene synthase
VAARDLASAAALKAERRTGNWQLATGNCLLARDTNFYYSFLVLPPLKRRAIVAVWDFCRAVDDAVDEARRSAPASAVADGAGGVLLVERRRRGRDRHQDVQPAARHVRRSSRASRWTSARGATTFEDLREYCVQVASAMGIICLSIFQCRDPRAACAPTSASPQ